MKNVNSLPSSRIGGPQVVVVGLASAWVDNTHFVNGLTPEQAVLGLDYYTPFKQGTWVVSVQGTPRIATLHRQRHPPPKWSSCSRSQTIAR